MNRFLLFCFVSFSLHAAVLPTPPLTFSTSYIPQTGNVINVASGGDFQAALNSANLGDTIVLQAGATYTGPFTLPNKTTGTGWVYVVSSAYSNLPAPSTRVSPNDAVNMPKILASNTSNALVTVANSNHYRFIGVEIAPVAGAFVYTLVVIGNADTSPVTLPNNIIFDRSYIHSDDTVEGRRGIEMDGAYVAVVDSYVSGFKQASFDTQALWAYNTTGPLKIVNNYLEAAGENVLFGGADSLSAALVPQDIEISNNYFFKPLSLINSGYVVKNMLEFKAAQRALVSGNTFENNPYAAQDGFALLVTPRNQNGAAPWSITADIIFEYNTLINVGGGFNIAGTDDNFQSLPTARILIDNNVLGIASLNGAWGRTYQILSGAADVTIDHNTSISATVPCCQDLMMADTAQMKANNLTFTNNLSDVTRYGFFGSNDGEGTAALNGQFTNWVFAKNVIVHNEGGWAPYYPPNNFFPVGVAAVGFTDYAGANYKLASGSPYRNAGTDGQDIGAHLCH